MTEKPDFPEFLEFTRALEAYDGSEAMAESLRTMALSCCGKRPQRAGQTAAEKAALKILAAYKDKAPSRLLAAALPGTSPCVGPFLGDPAMGVWPHHDPLGIPDEEALKWLPLVGRHAIPDAASREFVQILFRTRVRTTWVPAADAFAALALRDPVSLAELQSLWALCYPDGLPKGKWGHTLGTPARERFGDDYEDASHLMRHTVYTVCAFTALGGDTSGFPGFDAGRFASLKLPAGDSSDASAVLLGILALLRGEATRALALRHVAGRVEETRPEEMAEAAVREIADLLRADPALVDTLEAIETVLARPRWRQAPPRARLDSLWSWLETARWLQGHGRTAALESMRQQAIEAGEALAMRLGEGPYAPGNSVTDALLPRLKAALDDDVYQTTPEEMRACLWAEVFCLLDRKEIAELPWPNLVRRAFGLHQPSALSLFPGTVREAARAELALVLAARGIAPAMLLRDACFGVEVVLRLARSGDRFVARQVAVQTERILRLAAAGDFKFRLSASSDFRVRFATPGEFRVWFLWKLLQQNPPTDTFAELRTTLRGSATPLHELVAALQSLDGLRDREGESWKIAAARSEVTRGALSVLGQGGRPGVDGSVAATGADTDPAATASPAHSPGELLWALDGAIARLAGLPRSEVGSAGWMGHLGELLLGARGSAAPDRTGTEGGVRVPAPEMKPGLDSWMAWLGSAPPNLEDAWNAFREAVRAAREDRPAVTASHLEALRTAAAGLRRALSRVEEPGDGNAEGVSGTLRFEDAPRSGSGRGGGSEDEPREPKEELSALAWPESLFVQQVMRQLDDWQEELVRESRAAAGELDALRDALVRRDEPGVRTLINDPRRLRQIPSEEIRRAHRFLLDNLLFPEAEALRKRASERLALPSVLSHVAPFLAAVAAGPMLVLDMGTAWNEVVGAGHRAGLLAVTVLTFAGAFTLLVAALASRLAYSREHHRSRPGFFASLARRVAPAYLVSLAVAGLASAFVLWTLEGTETCRLEGDVPTPFLPQLFVWTGLSLFLGLLFIVFLQRLGDRSEG